MYQILSILHKTTYDLYLSVMSTNKLKFFEKQGIAWTRDISRYIYIVYVRVCLFVRNFDAKYIGN